MNTLKIKKLHPEAIVPKYATAGAACFDLHALLVDDHEGPYEDIVPTGCTLNIRTGLAFEIPEGYAMLIFSRSGHGFKNDVRLSNCVGVLDSDYRGEARVKLRNESPLSDKVAACLHVAHGDRIAQAMLVRVDQWVLEVVDELSSTERGEGGFGSTGVK